jgi:hypothetical protein
MEATAVSMKRSSHEKYPRWAVWLAVLIAVFSALAPAVSHALALNDGTAPGSIEICTQEGMRFVTVDPTGSSTASPAGQQSVLSLSHCPFCLHSIDRVAPPPHLLPYLFLNQGGQQEATVWQAFFFVDHTAFAPPPRGPPVSF